MGSFAGKMGAAAGGENKAKLVQIGDSYASLKDIIRIYPDMVSNTHGEPVYRIVLRYFKGYEFEEYYKWSGEQGEEWRDQEWSELHARLENAGYQFV